MTTAEQAKALKELSNLKTIFQQNPEMFSFIIQAGLTDSGMANIIKSQAGHVSVDNPQENWEKLLYVPTKFKTTIDDNGNEIPLSEEDKRKQVWGTINFRNMLGDAVSLLGGTGSIFANAKAQQARNTAQNSATQKQREIYGATASDRAAAAAIPMFQGLGSFSALLSGIIANRLYQAAGERKAAYLRSLMAAEHNNMGTSGMYSDTWRKVQDPIPNMSNSVAGGPKK